MRPCRGFCHSKVTARWNERCRLSLSHGENRSAQQPPASDDLPHRGLLLRRRRHPHRCRHHGRRHLPLRGFAVDRFIAIPGLLVGRVLIVRRRLRRRLRSGVSRRLRSEDHRPGQRRLVERRLSAEQAGSNGIIGDRPDHSRAPGSAADAGITRGCPAEPPADGGSCAASPVRSGERH